MDHKKSSDFDKVLGAWDILVIAFGAMIGWGWVVSSGDWIGTGGVFGAALGFVIGGMVINQAGVTLAHGMEHPASGLKDIVHGHGLAALTPAVIEASYKGNPEKFARISKLMGGCSAADCAEMVKSFLSRIDMAMKLSDLGLAEEDIPWMAENCMKVSAASVANNPVVFTQEEIAEIYRKAM